MSQEAGVSSAISVPALAGIPLTFRGIAASFAVLAGHCSDGGPAAWQRYAGVDTLVILMGVKHRAAIAAGLMAAGKPADMPVAFIQAGTTSRERVLTATLGEVAEGLIDVSAPAVLVVGEVVRVRERLGRRIGSAAGVASTGARGALSATLWTTPLAPNFGGC